MSVITNVINAIMKLAVAKSNWVFTQSTPFYDPKRSLSINLYYHHSEQKKNYQLYIVYGYKKIDVITVYCMHLIVCNLFFSPRLLCLFNWSVKKLDLFNYLKSQNPPTWIIEQGDFQVDNKKESIPLVTGLILFLFNINKIFIRWIIIGC